MTTKTLILVVAGCLSVSLGCESGEEARAAEPAAVPAEAQAEPAKKRAGADDRYVARGPEATVAVGSEAKATFRIEPRGDLKINKEYPWSIAFEPHEALSLGATTLGRGDLELADERAELPITVTATSAGEYTVSATGSFSVCNPQRCDILRDEPLEFTVVAVAAPAEAEPASN